MKMTDETKRALDAAVVAFLTEVESATRNELLEGAVARMGLTERQMQSHDAAGKYHTMRSYVGNRVDEMARGGALCRRDGRYMLTRDGLAIVEEGRCETQLRALLSKATYSKAELFDALDRHFGADLTSSSRDNAMVHSIAGSILARMVRDGEVSAGADGYALCSPAWEHPNRPMEAESFKTVFLARLHRMGGPFFERFLCNLLEKYYTVTGRTVLVCEVTGGSNDGGIDVVVDTRDGLGFFEHVMVQAKCRERTHVTEKEVREFYGALTALSGSRGIYATTSTFHEGAQRLLDSLDNCVGLDGDKLFALADMVSYGIVKSKKGYCFDEAIFKK